MKKTASKGGRKTNLKLMSLVVVAGVLATGSFAFASGMVPGMSDSFLASVFSAFSSRPAIIISRSNASPRGSIPTGVVPRVLAIFDVYSKNVTYAATLQSMTINVVASGATAQSLNLTNLAVSYRYCIPAGVKYGYGYMGGNCGTIPLNVSSISHNGNTFTLSVYSGTPIYPQAAGQITVSGSLAYRVGGLAGNSSQVRVSILAGTGTGDQCRAYTYGFTTHTYGYTQCVPLQASVYPASGNSLMIQRTYGYGYCLL